MGNKHKGCFRASIKSPISQFGFQEFNFSSYLNYKRNNFFGRKWLFQEMENFLENTRGTLGVLITGEPGSGKSALMSQLICSPFSSLPIHNNIIGYHMCDYSEKGKRDGARFVRNLVDQIAGSIPEYSDHVSNNEQIRKELDKRCESDSVGCFYSTIVGPLRELRKQPDSVQYILIDALDECFEKDGKSSTILGMLNSKISHFPNWLKVILSSRNWTAVTTLLPQTVKRITLDPADERNVEDIRSYINHYLSQNSFFMDRLLEAMGLTSTTEGINSLINQLSNKGEGNFLFIKTTLQYLNQSEGRINLQSFPTSLYDTYNIYFKRRFDEEEFSRFKVLFEVLLAANSPLQLSDIDSILKLQNKEYEASSLVKQVSAFLRFSQDGMVRIYHQSFTEWLVKQTDLGELTISKQKGHHYIADYLFDIIQKKNATPTINELSEIATHLSLGGMTVKYKKRLGLMNFTEIRDPLSGSCILHDLALKDGYAHVLDSFLQMFVSADIPDFTGFTPAFYAASEDNVNNLKLFIKKGIDVNYVFNSSCNITWDPLMGLIGRVENFNMIHIASYKGHTKTVELLIKSNAVYTRPSKFGLTPLHLAAQEGHLKVVELLYNNGASADEIALHRAAARSHVNVVDLLLKDTDIRDDCLPCKPCNLSDFNESATVQDIHVCLCETALHAAVSRRHLAVVKLLLSSSKAALECKHHSGKTPLMDAVEKNDTEMVELLLDAGANVEAACDREVLRVSTEEICVISSFFKNFSFYTLYCDEEICSCGNRPIHLCAMRGLWEIVEMMFESNVNILAENCKGLGAARIAAFYDHVDFIRNFNQTLMDKTDFFLNNKAFVFPTVICGSDKTLKLLLNGTNSDVFAENIGDKMTLLHYAAGWSPYPNSATGIKADFCPTVLSKLPCCYTDGLKKELSKRLSTVMLLVKSQEHRPSFVNKKNKHGRTALHFAALAGFVDAAEYLVSRGGDWGATGNDGRTPLTLALEATPVDPQCLLHCYRTTDQRFRICNTTVYDKTVEYFIWLRRSTIKRCNLESANLLTTLIFKRMPLSLYTLLKTGVDVNCDIGQSQRPFLLHLQIGGRQISEVLKMFEVNATVECDVPYEQSELHLMPRWGDNDAVGNFFKPSINKRPFPFQRLITNHPKGFRIFDECRDEEGYLVIHRAVEAANTEAIDWFIRSGADLSQTTRSGLTPLDVSIKYLGNPLQFMHFLPKGHEFISSERRHQTFEKLLGELLKTAKHKLPVSWCNPKLEELSPLHLSGIKGIGVLKFVYKRISKTFPGLPFNCVNKHGVTPLYLAHLYKYDHGLQDDNMKVYQTADEVINDKTVQYPDREVEYYLIYNHFYNSPGELAEPLYQRRLKYSVNEIMNCPNFSTLLPKKEVLRYKMDHCINDCLSLIQNVRFSFYITFRHIVLELYVEYYKSSVWLAMAMEMSRMKYYIRKKGFSYDLWRQTSRALNCAKDCHCTDIMKTLQELLTIQRRRFHQVNEFAAKRMSWTDRTIFGDVTYRWPFSFLFKMAMKQYKSYEYLKIVNNVSGLFDGYTYYYSNDFDKDK